MKLRLTALGAVLAVGALASGPALASTQAPGPTPATRPIQQDVSLPGSPFATAATPDGKYVFASLSGAVSGIAIVKQGPRTARLVRVLPTGSPAYGLTVTRDGKYLLDTVQAQSSAEPTGVQVIDIEKAAAGDPGAILGTVPAPYGSQPVEVALSNDGRFAFATNEANETVGVIDFDRAIKSGVNASALVGTIPVDMGPVGLAFSPDGRYLYISNELANTSDPGYDLTACNIPTGVGTGTIPGPQGTLTVVDLRKAETDPAGSVLASVYAGCTPVRVDLSADGTVAWVTDRASDEIAAYSTRRLIADPSHALISRTPVGAAPVGLQIFDNDRLIAVSNSNRFTTGEPGSVSILNYRKALSGAGASATTKTFTVGDFPRQWALSTGGQFLYLTEFSSNTLTIFPVREFTDPTRR
jgi:DNA-binding beta-propeller fold protein YncE